MQNSHTVTDELIEVDIEKILTNPSQPRQSFSQSELEELAASIQQIGIIHPPLVRPLDNGTFELIAGERRLRAAKFAGLQTISVLVRKLDPNTSAQLALIENIQRSDLNAIEIAEALEQLAFDWDCTQEQLANRLGKSRSSIANYLRLLTLPDVIQDAIREQKISFGHAKVILSFSKEEDQIACFKKIIGEKFSVKETEKYAKQHTLNEKPQDCHLRHLEELLQYKLGTKVTFHGNGNQGKLTIEYYNLDDLDRIMKILQINEN